MSDAFERIEIWRLAKCFGVSEAKAEEAQGNLGAMYRQLAASPANQDARSDRAFKYVDQLEAHMDEGGLTAPNNVRDLIQMVRELCGIITSRDYDLFHLRKSVETKCMQCGLPIALPYQVYRCTDCSMPFHQDCAKLHFASVPSVRRSAPATGAVRI